MVGREKEVEDGGVRKIKEDILLLHALMPLDGKERDMGTEREIKVHLKRDTQQTPIFTVCQKTETLYTHSLCLHLSVLISKIATHTL